MSVALMVLWLKSAHPQAAKSNLTVMTTVAEHYEHHLAPLYLWMSGGFDATLSTDFHLATIMTTLPVCGSALLIPVLRRRRSPKFFSLFAHKGGDPQWSEAELPVAGKYFGFAIFRDFFS